MFYETLSKLAILSSLALSATIAAAQSITPTRVGPVSQYGQLMTGKNSSGKGQIYGSCEGVKDGAEVQVRGMSLYWSLMPQAVEFWSEEGVSTMVRDMNIQIVRAAMATGNEDWNNGYKGYGSDPTTQMNLMKTVVEAAIKNDIYVIIDWHSHNANEQTESAKNFFKQMAQTYGKYDNVIFELFNEPTDISWSTIKNYADQVVSVIREYSDNLILVGTPRWDQNPHAPIGNEVTDSKKNTAYTLHYYANSHCWSGSYDWSDPTWGSDCEGTKGEKAMNAGLSVFVSEWGTANSDGGGDPNQGRNQSWQDYMNKHKLSWANWSASYISEGTAAFQGGSSKTSLQYTTSGNLVKGYLATNPTSYTKCGNGGNNNGGNENGNNEGETPIFVKTDLNNNVTFAGKALYVAGKPATVEIFNIQGSKLMSIDNVSGTLSLAMLPAGKYLAKIHGNGASQVRAFQIK